MNSKTLVILIGIAAGLAGAAYLTRSGNRPSGAKLNGRTILPGLDVSKIARVDCGKLALAAKDTGWTVESYQDYPADQSRLAENLMALTELKVGQTARGKKLAETKLLKLKDAEGGEIASVTLGEKHPTWGHGRYLAFEGETVLVADTLDAFDGDPKRWIETKIVDEPRISFNDLADATVTEAELGFATGVVAKVTVAGDTNRTVTVGNAVKGGSDRYLKLDGSKWTFIVPEYAVRTLLPKPEEPKSAEEPKSEEPKSAEESKSAE